MDLGHLENVPLKRKTVKQTSGKHYFQTFDTSKTTFYVFDTFFAQQHDSSCMVSTILCDKYKN